MMVQVEVLSNLNALKVISSIIKLISRNPLRPLSSILTIDTKDNSLMETLKMMKSTNKMIIYLIVILIKPLIAISYSNVKFLRMNHVLKIINVDSIIFVIIKFVKEIKVVSVKLSQIAKVN